MDNQELLDIETIIAILEDCESAELTPQEAATELYDFMRRRGRGVMDFNVEVGPRCRAALAELHRLLEASPLDKQDL